MESKLAKSNELISNLWAQIKEKDDAEQPMSKLEEEVTCKKENLVHLESDVSEKNSIIKDLGRRINARDYGKITA